MAAEGVEGSMAVRARPAAEANTMEASTEGGNTVEAMRITVEAMRITAEAVRIIMEIMGDTPGGGG